MLRDSIHFLNRKQHFAQIGPYTKPNSDGRRDELAKKDLITRSTSEMRGTRDAQPTQTKKQQEKTNSCNILRKRTSCASKASSLPKSKRNTERSDFRQYEEKTLFKTSSSYHDTRNRSYMSKKVRCERTFAFRKLNIKKRPYRPSSEPPLLELVLTFLSVHGSRVFAVISWIHSAIPSPV
jgi:hypothetical protein